MFGYAPRLNGLSHVIVLFFGAIGTLVGFVVVVGLLILLARFLWFGTIAARLYVAKNSPQDAAAGTVEPAVEPVAEPVVDEPASASPGPVGAPVEPSSAPSSVVPPVTPSATPPTKPRTPRTPKTPPTDKP
jgi:hypothetical protein